MRLTKNQEIFCQEVVKQDTYSAAYRIAYNTSNWTDKSVNEKASQMMADVKILSRVNELRKNLESENLYTLKQSVARDLKLIERYESALDVLENIVALPEEVEAAERMIKFIGASGYSNAQERLSKQHGFFERDNEQKAIPVRQVVDMSDYKNKT